MDASQRDLQKIAAMEAREQQQQQRQLRAALTEALSTDPSARTAEQQRLLDEHATLAAALKDHQDRAAVRRADARARRALQEEDTAALDAKLDTLAELVRGAEGRTVLYTGAGMSTAAGIPDWRGPAGLWTLKRKGVRVEWPRVDACAPTAAHMACVGLMAAGHASHCVTQNIDGLHMRAGLPEDRLLELHGSVYRSRCVQCGRRWRHAGDVTRDTPPPVRELPGGAGCGVGGDGGDGPRKTCGGRLAYKRHGIGQSCPECGSDLQDTIVNFGERLDEDVLAQATAISHQARLALCLGTSLKVPPAKHLPCNAERLVTVSLQWTAADKRAALNIHAPCDAVLLGLAQRLRVPVPTYTPSAHVITPPQPGPGPVSAPPPPTQRRAPGHTRASSPDQQRIARVKRQRTGPVP